MSLEDDARLILAANEQEDERSAKWPCIACQGPTKVYDTRGSFRGRECKDCGRRFLTEEQYVRPIRTYRNRKAPYLGKSA